MMECRDFFNLIGFVLLLIYLCLVFLIVFSTVKVLAHWGMFCFFRDGLFVLYWAFYLILYLFFEWYI